MSSFITLLVWIAVIAFLLALVSAFNQYSKGLSFWRGLILSWIGFFGIAAIFAKIFFA